MIPVVFLLITLIVFLAKLYKGQGMIISPGFLFPFFWSVVLFVYLVFDDGKNDYYGILWICVCLFVFAIAFLFGNGIEIKSNIRMEIFFSKRKIRRYIIIAGALTTLIYLVDYLKSGGVQNVAQVAYDYYNNAEELSTVGTILNQVKSMLLYSVAILGGVYAKIEKKLIAKLLSVLVFVPSVLGMLTTSGKLGLITCIIMYVVGYLIAVIYGDSYVDFSFYLKLVKKYWKPIVIAFLLLFVSFLLRFGSFKGEAIDLAKGRMLSYGFGSPAAFNDWFINGSTSELEWGKNTFTAIAKVFVSVDRKQGVYEEMFRSSVWETNVYSAFRSVIQDFGRIGGVLFFVVLGFFSGVVRKHFILTHSLISVILLGMSYLFIFFSLFNSPFVYMNLTIAFPFTFIAVAIILKENDEVEYLLDELENMTELNENN